MKVEFNRIQVAMALSLAEVSFNHHEIFYAAQTIYNCIHTFDLHDAQKERFFRNHSILLFYSR